MRQDPCLSISFPNGNLTRSLIRQAPGHLRAHDLPAKDEDREVRRGGRLGPGGPRRGPGAENGRLTEKWVGFGFILIFFVFGFFSTPRRARRLRPGLPHTAAGACFGCAPPLGPRSFLPHFLPPFLLEPWGFFCGWAPAGAGWTTALGRVSEGERSWSVVTQKAQERERERERRQRDAGTTHGCCPFPSEREGCSSDSSAGAGARPVAWRSQPP